MNESTPGGIAKFGGLNRRNFIKKSAVTAAGVAALPWLARGAGGGAVVAIVLEAEDAVASKPPVRWAAEQLRAALTARGVEARIYDAVEQVPAGAECVVATGRGSASARQVFGEKNAVPDKAEALGYARGQLVKRKALVAAGADSRGLVYALLELADKVNTGGDAIRVLHGVEAGVEQPANQTRSVGRIFASDVEDKPWYNDRSFWQDYLTMLATERINRFHLVLGLAYDFTTGIRDCYFHFAYPFLLSVPGYDVKAAPLPDAERDSNLEMMRYISEQCALRGVRFQLGLWTHAYRWTNSPEANYRIEGLTDETQAPYCRDALKSLLTACPLIDGVSIRIHGESGVQEGSYEFWATVFDGIVRSGRKVDLELHAKGLDQKLLDVALATNLPVSVAPKFWAEHMGLPYPQAAIRPLEMPRRNPNGGLMSLSTGSRNHTRYGYADFMVENRKYGVMHRIWPGTQRVLLWGDPEMAAAYGQASGFCGSDGYEWFESLAFKGRKGSGATMKPGNRQAYADASLNSGVHDFEKYRYTYRLWGRLGYRPDEKPEVWRRLLRNQFGDAAEPAERALASASRILPLVTTAHCPSAANNNYWPEIYWNMPIVGIAPPQPYSDTPSPHRFGTVSTLDPELFSGIEEHAQELLSGRRSGKYSPAEVAQWLQQLADTAARELTATEAKAKGDKSVEFRRFDVDVAIQSGLGRFFAWKFRAGLLYAMYRQTGHRSALERALSAYRLARNAWADLAERARGVYLPDIAYGMTGESRGHWLDRLAGVDADIAAMQGQSSETWAPETAGAPIIALKTVEAAMSAALEPPARPELKVEHKQAGHFKRGEAVSVQAQVRGKVEKVILRYRVVSQAEAWQAVAMESVKGKWSGAIPAAYTDTAFPLQYYFELRDAKGGAALHPGLGKELMGQPYFVVRQI